MVERVSNPTPTTVSNIIIIKATTSAKPPDGRFCPTPPEGWPVNRLAGFMFVNQLGLLVKSQQPSMTGWLKAT
jgi:hypothetical protein